MCIRDSKCTEQELSSFEKIIEWRLKFFKLSNVNRTCFDNEWKKDYYKALFPLNPNQLIPVLPSLKEIMKILNSIDSESKYQVSNIKNCNQKFLDLIHKSINNGVYRCGFARNQSAYEKASKNLFAALNEVENSLKKHKGDWIFGEELTYADIYLFPTLIRWELIYSKLFKCTEQELSNFEKIIEWRFKFFKLSNVDKTCYDNEWKKDYYKALFPLNPNQLIPVLPSLKEIMKVENEKIHKSISKKK